MVLAHLRGQLESGYPRGLQSVLRENLILQAVDMEVQATLGIHRMTIESAFSGAYSPEGAKEMLKIVHESWRRYSRMTELCYEALQTTTVKPLDAPGKIMAKLHAALEKSGLFEQIRKRDEKLQDELTEDG